MLKPQPLISAMNCVTLYIFQMWLLALMLATGLVSAQDKAGWMKSLKTLDEVRSQNSDSNDFVETVHVIFMNHLGKSLILVVIVMNHCKIINKLEDDLLRIL